jgi:kynurenine formamidase
MSINQPRHIRLTSHPDQQAHRWQIDWAAATAEMAVIEYLTNVAAIADHDAFFMFAPVKIAGTRGGYGRAIALIGD